MTGDLSSLQEEIRAECPNVHDVTVSDDRITCAFVTDDYDDKTRFMHAFNRAADVLRDAGLSVDRPTSVNKFGATFIEGRTE